MRLSRPYLRAVLCAVPFVVLLAACGSSGGNAGSNSPVVSSTPNTTTATSPSASGTCAYPSDGQTPAKDVGTPSTTNLLAPTTLTLNLKVGSGAAKPVAITLKAKTAPCTVNAISYLASKGYYDNTTCHRLTTAESGISVLQCGDPTATGSGGPGFSFADELSGSETYPAGTVAMANTGQPVSNGSQFFLVYGDTPLPAKYTVFGTITSGLDVVTAIGAAGSDNANGSGDGHPKQTVTITSAKTS
jgi:peptidyl-prolyl cis-trans isomerase B (cyclophilin B)